MNWLDQYDDEAIKQQCARLRFEANLIVLGTIFAAVMVGLGLLKLMGLW